MINKDWLDWLRDKKKYVFVQKIGAVSINTQKPHKFLGKNNVVGYLKTADKKPPLIIYEMGPTLANKQKKPYLQIDKEYNNQDEYIEVFFTHYHAAMNAFTTINFQPIVPKIETKIEKRKKVSPIKRQKRGAGRRTA